jgi:hypothetical protein
MRSLCLLAAIAIPLTLTATTYGEETAPDPKQAEYEQQFVKSLKGAVLVGNFSTIKAGKESTPNKDRYKIVDLKKMANGYWLFTFQYGKNPTPIPIPLPVKWAGDTPVIALTDVAIPGLGTFSCRVLFHGKQYAGTWKHGEVVGNMWGVIARDEPKKKK